MPALRSFLAWLIGIVIFLLVTSLAFNAFTYGNFNPTYGFLRLKQQAIATGWYLPSYYAHVLASGAILIIGLFQINERWSLRWRPLHRVVGRCYAYGVLFFAAPGAFIMSLFIQRGPWVLLSFMLQTILWFIFTALAVNAVKKGNIILHRQWMIRSYALAFAAVTLRLYVFVSSSSFDLSSPDAYSTIAWLSWTLNLLVVEIYLRRFSKSNSGELNHLGS